VRYLHSEVDTLERVEILRDLRKGEFDVLVGINLLREGLDIPEVSLVAVLDADKEGFLRSERSLIQTIGRASRNANGKVILYADRVTKSMRLAIDTTRQRRETQQAHNEKHGITPKTVVRAILDMNTGDGPISVTRLAQAAGDEIELSDPDNLKKSIAELRVEMRQAADDLDFERAAQLRDRAKHLEDLELALR